MYFVSKTLAEQAAWKFAKENNLDFISIIPPLVVGPFLMPSMPPSLITALSPITGTYSRDDPFCHAIGTEVYTYMRRQE
jgi:bifunctional dihydroflavonol 4-reductase/flavanone 4-reductase